MCRPSETCHYKVLGVSPSATPAEIKSAYREISRRHHPGKLVNRSSAEKAAGEVQMRAINNANDVLGDASSRAKFDAKCQASSANTSQNWRWDRKHQDGDNRSTNTGTEFRSQQRQKTNATHSTADPKPQQGQKEKAAPRERERFNYAQDTSYTPAPMHYHKRKPRRLHREQASGPITRKTTHIQPPMIDSITRRTLSIIPHPLLHVPTEVRTYLRTDLRTNFQYTSVHLGTYVLPMYVQYTSIHLRAGALRLNLSRTGP